MVQTYKPGDAREGRVYGKDKFGFGHVEFEALGSLQEREMRKARRVSGSKVAVWCPSALSSQRSGLDWRTGVLGGYSWCRKVG